MAAPTPLAAALQAQAAERADQARRTLDAQRNAAQAVEQTVAALSRVITELQAQREQDRAESREQITLLQRTVTAQGALIEQLTHQLREQQQIFRQHTHGFDRTTGMTHTLPGELRPFPHSLHKEPYPYSWEVQVPGYGAPLGMRAPVSTQFQTTRTQTTPPQ